MSASLILATIASVAAVGTHPPPGCAYDNCFWKEKIPSEWKPAARSFCQALVGKQPCSTKTVTAIQTLPPTTLVSTKSPITVLQTTQSTSTIYDSVVETISQIDGTVCTTSTTTPVTTEVSFPRFTPAPRMKERAVLDAQDEREYQELMKRTKLPDFMSAGCQKAPALDKLKAACKCFLQEPPKVVTVTQKRPGATVINTLPAQTKTVISTLKPQTTTITTTNTIIATVQTCTSTSTRTFARFSNCGAPAGTYSTTTTGQITCTQPAAAPSGSVNALHRIEGNSNEGTIFEGCIYAGPRSISTPSGGTHQCGASTGTTITEQLDAAAQLNGFTYDGSFSNQFNDFFITRIGNSQQGGNSYWGILQNNAYTPTGGCQTQVQPGDNSLWLFDAFNMNGLLAITPAYAIAQIGSTVRITVTSNDLNGGAFSPYAGATLSGNGAQSNSNGVIEFPAPATPGCYQYKATASFQGRSNAFYLNVVGSFPVVIE